MSVLPVGFGSSGGLQITNSVRLRAAASAYFSRTFGTPTDDKKWAHSFWIKGWNEGGRLINAGTASGTQSFIELASGNIRFICAGAATFDKVTTQVFRDPSAWYHIVVIFDSANATAEDRNQIWVNGSRVTSFSTSTNAGLNAVGYLNVASTGTSIGAPTWTSSNYFDGYLSDVYFVDGQALTPSSFAETNSDGVWVPKAYTGTYGTNGFHLDFEDAALTAGSNVGLGKDVSGNGNYWTTNNISVTAGVTYDSMVDTPTNNYATLNPLAVTASSGVISAGGLTTSGLSTGGGNVYGTIAIPASGKYYYEVNCTTNTSTAGMYIGLTQYLASLTYASNSTNSVMYTYAGNKDINGSDTAYGSTYTDGDVIGVAVNADATEITFYKNNVSQGAISHAVSELLPTINDNNNAAAHVANINFGQRPFAYTPPTGFKALCTANRTGTITVSGTFTGNAAADGPFVWIGGVPTVLTINGNAVTFGTHADKTAGGFKLRTASASYNASGSNTWTATATMNFGTTNLAPAPAQGNP